MPEETTGSMSREDMERIGVVPTPRKRDSHLLLIGGIAMVVGVIAFFWAFLLVTGIHIHWQGLWKPALLFGGLLLAFFGLITLLVGVFKKSADAARRK